MSFRPLAFGAVALFAGSFALPCFLGAQESPQDLQAFSAVLSEAPQPQFPTAAEDSSSQDGVPAGQPAPSAGSSSTQSLPQQTDRQKAAEQIKEEEQQRILGVVPMFNTSYRNDAVSLTSKEKMKLAFRSAVDPVTFGVAATVAGIAELNPAPNNNGFGWGAEGYAKRWGAAYLDSFNGTMIGNGILPSIFHQDPRYFRLGRGSTTHRLLYAMSTTVMCKHDSSRRWEPNYSNVGGNLIAGYISNLYYPDTDRSGWEQTLASGLIVTAEGTLGGIFQEFWPDISRKLFHKDPTHGLDAQIRAEDAARRDKDKNQPLSPAPK